jgi:hypothetical protein
VDFIMRFFKDWSCDVQVRGFPKRVQAAYDLTTHLWVLYDQEVRVMRKTLSATMKAYRQAKQAIL